MRRTLLSKLMPKLIIGTTFAGALGVLAVTERALEHSVEAQAKSNGQVPIFEVDPFWPKTMPNSWILGQTIGLGVDERDQVWIIHRGNDMTPEPNLDPTEYARPPLRAPGAPGAPGAPPAPGAAPAGAPPAGAAPPTPQGAAGVPVTRAYTPGNRVSECCDPAPPVVAFDQAGNIVHSWGGPALHPDWPDSNHGIIVDHKGLVWIGGNGGPDSHILKFTREGKFVAMFGRKGARQAEKGFARDADDMENFGRVAKISFDSKANEAYVADGYFNKRVAVIDMESGKVKRYWGGYGEKPDNAEPGRYNPKEGPSRQFRTPVHCAELAVDGMVYVCDRPNDRIQVFTKDGKFVKEKQIFPETLSDGSVWDIAFSRDPQQRFLYLADGANEHIYVLDRNSLDILSQFGTGGRGPGQFRGVHGLAVDSKGNIYTTETYSGKRIQKFVMKGMGAPQRGVPWPTRGN